MSNKAVIDIENGGFSKNAAIVEIAMIVVDENLNELKRWSTLVNRYFIQGTEELCTYSEDAIAIHGITEEMQAAEGKPPKEVVIEMESIIQDYNIMEFIGHSLNKFDIPRLIKFFDQFSAYECEDLFPFTLDIKEFAKDNFDLYSYSLESICEAFNVVNDNPHRAEGDCEATLNALKAMKDELY